MTEQTQTLSPLNPFSTISKISQPIEQLTSRAKLTLAHQLLEKLHLKFPRLVDFSISRELDRIAALVEDDFVQQRTAPHLFKLAYSIAFVRKKLSQERPLLPLKSCYDIRFMPFSLHFTFGSKPILGILAHAYLQDKYQSFDEEHILLKIRRLIAEAQLVKGSIYVLHPPKSTLKNSLL